MQALQDANHESVQVGGLNVRFVHAGRGPTLVLVHGLLGYSFSWRFALPILARGREVFAPDMPGSGFSDCDGSLDCGVKAAAERLSRFLDSVGVQSCDLLGSSYGGTTALMFAAMESTRVRTLTVVSPANPWSNIGRKRLALLNTPVIGTAFPPLARVFRPVHRYFVRRMYGDASLVTRETLKGYGRPLGRPGLFEHAVKIARAWRLSMSELEAALPALASTPVLLIWGSKDRLVEAASAERLKSHLPHSTLKVMMGSGHLPYEEHPEEFCRIVQEFLMKHQPSQGARQEVT